MMGDSISLRRIFIIELQHSFLFPKPRRFGYALGVGNLAG